MSIEPITGNETFSLHPQVRYRQVADEGVLVHLARGRVLVLNAVGLHIVQTLQQPQTRETLVRSILDRFAVEEAQASADLDAYLQALEQEEVLIRQR